MQFITLFSNSSLVRQSSAKVKSLSNKALAWKASVFELGKKTSFGAYGMVTWILDFWVFNTQYRRNPTIVYLLKDRFAIQFLSTYFWGASNEDVPLIKGAPGQNFMVPIVYCLKRLIFSM